MKNFLKPTYLKIFLSLAVLALTYFIPKVDYLTGFMPTGESVRNQVDIWGVGYPMFYGENAMGDVIFIIFLWPEFLLNLILAYLISCFIIYMLNYKTKKNQNDTKN